MKIFLSVFFIFLSFYSYGQTTPYNTAIESYLSHAYSQAIPLLHLALQDEKNASRNARLNYALGVSYYENAVYETALEHFDKAIEYGYDASAILHKAITLKTIGRYDEAIDVLRQYLDISQDSSLYNNLTDGIALAIEFAKTPPKYKVYPLPAINSTSRDYAPSFIKDSTHSTDVMVFTSSRHSSLSAADDRRSGESSSRLYYTHILGGDSPSTIIWSSPAPWQVEHSLKEHIGASSFSRDGKMMFYTLCSGNDGYMSCVIECRTKLDDGTWSHPHLIVKADSNLSVGHPSISPDGKILFYTATTPRGDKDIYLSRKIDDNTWGKGESISSINTTGDEMFPYISNDYRLYFSSNGHKGMGGLDIFYSDYKNDSFSPPINIGSPINSSADDFALVESPHNEFFYFSSSRGDGSGYDDIYIAHKIPHLHTIEGKVVDNITGRPIDNVKIRIEGSNGRIFTLYTDARGDFTGSKDIIEGDNMYKLSFFKERYLTLSLSTSTYGINDDEYTPSDEGYLHTTRIIAEMNPMTSPVVLPRIEYDFDKATLRPESKKALDELVITLEENPDIVIELRSHTDHRGSDEYNIDLSKRRAASCVEYLISRGIAPHRLHSQGIGRSEPFIIPEYFESSFDAGTVLSEDFIRSLDNEKLDEEARQYNRRTDFKVLGIAIEKPIITSYTHNNNSNDTLIDVIPTAITYVIDSLRSSDTEKFQEATKNSEILFYTLKTGENYATVERLFNIPVSEIRRINGGLRGIMPYEGLILKVSLTADYSDYDSSHHRIERTETTIDRLLTSIGLSREEFIRLNPSYDIENIKAGEIIIIRE